MSNIVGAPAVDRGCRGVGGPAPAGSDGEHPVTPQDVHALLDQEREHRFHVTPFRLDWTGRWHSPICPRLDLAMPGYWNVLWLPIRQISIANSESIGMNQSIEASLGAWSDGPGPLHRKLGDRIRRAIDQGLLAPGERLPAER